MKLEALIAPRMPNARSIRSAVQPAIVKRAAVRRRITARLVLSARLVGLASPRHRNVRPTRNALSASIVTALKNALLGADLAIQPPMLQMRFVRRPLIGASPRQQRATHKTPALRSATVSMTIVMVRLTRAQTPRKPAPWALAPPVTKFVTKAASCAAQPPPPTQTRPWS